jgi:hypothetical protein
MAKNGSSGGKGRKEDKPETEESAAPWDAIPEALRDAGRRATDLAQNPYARSLLAAGLVTAAAALAANKNVRDATRRNLKDATDAAEVAADNASKIGAAIINAATEAVQRMINLAGAAATAEGEGGETSAPAKAAPEPTSEPATRPAATESAAPKPRARQAKSGGADAGKGQAEPKAQPATRARKSASGDSSAKGEGKKVRTSASAGGTRKRAPKQDG